MIPMIYQVQVPIGSLPVNLVLVGNKERGNVVFVKVGKVGTIIDQSELKDNVGAVFIETNFCFFEEQANGAIESFEYNTLYEYKDIPLMLRWLQRQELQQPQ